MDPRELEALRACLREEQQRRKEAEQQRDAAEQQREEAEHQREEAEHQLRLQTHRTQNTTLYELFESEDSPSTAIWTTCREIGRDGIRLCSNPPRKPSEAPAAKARATKGGSVLRL
ncbi:hypothetical protein MY10362_009002 [Beauveria mimosiformis]